MCEGFGRIGGNFFCCAAVYETTTPQTGQPEAFVGQTRAPETHGHRGALSDATAVLMVLAGFIVGFRQVLGASTGFRGFRGFRKIFRTGFGCF